MSLWRIAWKNMKQRGVASTLTVLSMALGVAVMVGVIVIHSVTVRQFSQDAQGYHLIVGGKGGALQLVMSTVYHLGQPLYPIPYDYYREFVDGRFAGVTDVAVPYCLGDSFDPTPEGGVPTGRLFRVVATTPDLFDKIAYGAEQDGTPRRYEFRSGRNFQADRAFEAVLGSVVAAQSGLKVSDPINPTHGVSGEGDKHDAFKVVGVLEPTGTANDRAVFVNIEGFYLLEGHALAVKERESELEATVLGSAVASNAGATLGDKVTPTTPDGSNGDEPYEVVAILRSTGTNIDQTLFTPLDGASLPPVDKESTRAGGAVAPPALYDNQGNPITPLPEPQREVTSILVRCVNSMGPLVLTTKINKDASGAAQAVSPAGVVAQLLQQIVAPMQLVLLVLTILIVLVASISILVSIYNSMSERAHDIAVMRALGASRTAVMLVVLTESILLSLAGGVLGILLGHSLIALAAPYVEAQAGVRLAFWEFDPLEIALIPSLVGLATLVGFLPAMSAYRTDVAKALSGSG